MRAWTWLSLAAALLPTSLWSAEPLHLDGIAAIVGTDLITLSEVKESTALFAQDPALASLPPAQQQTEVLNRMIDERLIAQAAGKAGIGVTDEDIDRTIDNIARQNGLTRDTLIQELTRQQIPIEEYRSNLRQRLLEARYIEQVIRPRVNVTEAQMRAYYSREVANLGKSATSAEVWVIFLAWNDGDEASRQQARQKAEAITEQLKSGSEFGQLARATSDHPSAADGGLLGTFTRGELFPALDQVVFSLKPGQVSAPVETPQGVFLLKSAVKESASTLSFEQARPDIEQLLYAEEQQRQLDLWLAEARKSAHIEIRLPSAPPTATQPR